MHNQKPLPTAAENILKALRARQRQRTAIRGGMLGVFAGTIAAIIAVSLTALAAANFSPLLWLWCIPAGGLGGALTGLLLPVRDLHIARALDRAAASDDRFASAIQLTGHHRQQRVGLVFADALDHVSATPAQAALPLRVPYAMRWLPVPVLVLALVCWLAPGLGKAAPPAPQVEVTPEEWAQISEEFREALRELPKPETEEEKEAARELEELASLLDKRPSKQEALAEIARLQARVDERRKKANTPEVNMKKAAEALQANAATKKLAELLRQGRYQEAADEMKALAAQLNEGTLQLSAEEFESLAESFEQAALELASNEELQQACQNCSGACNSMNRDKLAEALKRFSQCLSKASQSLKQCDQCRSTMSLLDLLRMRLSQCGRCNGDGDSPGFVRRNDKKGGLKAGWGTASNWQGGQLDKTAEQRDPSLADVREGPGFSSASPTVSTDERAAAAQAYRESFAEMIRKAEADLGLESVPLVYREYLRRYFNAIKPADSGDEEEQ